MSGPLDEILKRLDAIERRLARLEAQNPSHREQPEASNAADFESVASATGAQHASANRPAAATEPSPIAATPAAKVPTAPIPAPVKVAVGDEPKSYSSTATAPSTERLHPLSKERASADDPFPDLSMLDEKVEQKKGPAEKLDVRAAIEDLPRISSRIQQLWGSPECESYINNLVIDTRGNRKGFPPAVMEELLYLGRLARALVILGIDGDIWDTFDQVGDRR